MKYACLLLAFALGFAAVDTQAEPDPHSYAEPAKVLVSTISGSPDALVTPAGASDFREMAMPAPYSA